VLRQLQDALLLGLLHNGVGGTRIGSEMAAYFHTGFGIVLRLPPEARTTRPSTHTRSPRLRSISKLSALMPSASTAKRFHVTAGERANHDRNIVNAFAALAMRSGQ